MVADDISDFQIEGMSVGDNILDYFSEKQLINFSRSYSDGYNWIEVFSDVEKNHQKVKKSARSFARRFWKSVGFSAY